MYISELVHVEYWENSNSYPLFKKSREYHGLIMNLNSNAILIKDGKSYRTEYGNISYYPKGMQYNVELEHGKIKNIVINFEGEGFDDWFSVKDCADLIPQFEMILSKWTHRRPYESDTLECVSLVYHLLGEVVNRLERQGVPKHKREWLSKVIDYIHANYTSPDLKVSDLAPIVGVSDRYLYRIFCDVTGMSAKKYIDSLRLKHADELLSIGHSVSETAQLVGFRDVYHFSSFYKKERGMPPSQRNRET